jgi:hypothetical protein
MPNAGWRVKPASASHHGQDIAVAVPAQLARHL